MRWQKLVLDSFQRVEQELEKVLDGLTEEELNRQPVPDCNSIGWLAWHATRSIDRNMSEVMGEEQLWIKDKWHARFGRAPDPNETGAQHTTEQAQAFKSPPAKTILEYHQAIISKVENYINNKLDDKELSRESFSPTLKKTSLVEDVIAAQFWQGMHHVGQAGYVRGLLKGKGWYGR